jgi:hypothetical protein
MKSDIPLTFTIPAADAREFSELPGKTRKQVTELLSVMRSIHSRGGKVKVIQEIADAEDSHFNTIYQKWKDFRDSGDWRVLVDRRHTPEFWNTSKSIGLPPEFITEWKTRVENNDRAAKPAWQLLIQDWKQWRKGNHTKAVPGYARCPAPAPGSHYPRGWTYSNLLNHMPDDVEAAASRKGRVEAKKLLPGVHTTRVGSYPFAEIQFDDMFHDFMVTLPGYQKTYRLLEFNGIDRFTAFMFKPGLKPRLPDMDTGKMKILNGRDFHLYLVNWLLDYGWHPEGTVFNVENAVASISRGFEDKLFMWSNGKLTVRRAGMSGAPAFPGSWKERAKGNPNAKALKEGMGKLIHNALAGLPGQCGMNYEDAPASLAGRTAEANLLLAISAAVPELREKLALGFIDLTDAVHAVNETYERLNCRTDHEMEGWAELGLIIQEFCANRNTDTWLPLEAAAEGLSESERHLFGLAIRSNPFLCRQRRLSPAEVILVTAPRLIRLPHEAIPDLLGADYGQCKTVNGGLIRFTVPGIGKLRYRAIYQDASGFRRRVENGAEVLAHLNPWKPEFIYLSNPETLRFLGRAPRHTSVCQSDIEAIRHAHGRAERDFKEAVREVAARHGLTRLPGIKANTAVLRAAAKPSAREHALAAAGFDSATMLDKDPDGPLPADASASFDPADLDPSNLL